MTQPLPPGLFAPGPGADSKGRPTKDLVGTVVSDRYRIDGLLGEGGMGAVYAAEHVHMRKKVAIKVLHAEMVQRDEAVARFEREAVAAGHINHPNVAAATDFGRMPDGAWYLVLELLDGRSLRAALEAEAPFPVTRAVHIARQMLSALARAHDLGIVHRDLKPENVFLTPREGDGDFVKILDFGIAKVAMDQVLGGEAGTALTQAGLVYGTPEYMAPEQMMGRPCDGRTDLFALGLVFYEMLAGRHPFHAENRVALMGAQMSSPTPDFASRGPGIVVPPAVEGVVRKLLAKAPEDRFESARATLEALEAAAGVEVLGVVGPASPAYTSRPPPRLSFGDPVALMREAPSWWMRLVGVKDGGPTHERRAVARWLLGGALVVFAAVAVLFAGRRLGGGVAGRGVVTGASVTADPPAPPTAPHAPEADLDAARRAGAGALAELLGRYPADGAVARAVFLARVGEMAGGDPGKDGERDGDSAFHALQGLATVAPERLLDDEVLAALRTLVASSSAAADRVLGWLETAPVPGAPEMLWDLGTAKETEAKHGARALRALRLPAVREKASPALSVALDLRGAGTCTAKKALLARAAETGDRRSLGPLRALVSTKGCGFLGLKDCWPCLRGDRQLDNAVHAIEQRGR